MITIPLFNIEVIDQYNAQHFVQGSCFSFLDNLTLVVFFGESVEAVFKDPIMVKKHPCYDKIEIKYE